MAVMLQSSTAVAMLACGFAASGVLALPVCLFLGGVIFLKLMFLKLPRQKVRETGRMVLGVGFVLLSLKLIGEATEPLREAPCWRRLHRARPCSAGSRRAVGARRKSRHRTDRVLAIAWYAACSAAHSNRQPAVWGIGAGAALLAVGSFGSPIEIFGGNDTAALIDLHVIFNACLLVLCLPLTGLMAKLTRALLPEPAVKEEGGLLANRDRAVIGNPKLALASASRELLRMGELVEIMVRPVMELLSRGTREAIARVRKIDKEVNRAHTGIKLYLAEVTVAYPLLTQSGDCLSRLPKLDNTIEQTYT
jgi:phosphate:Na+ symporter